MVRVIQSADFTAVTAPASHLSLALRPIDGDQVVPARLSDVLTFGVEAAINGPMFSFCRGQQTSYAAAQCEDLDYLHYTASLGRHGPLAPGGVVISIIRDWTDVRAVMGYTPDQRAEMAVQLYPSLIENGRNTASEGVNTDYVWRSGVGIMQDGRVVLAVAHDTMRGFAERMRLAGVMWAGYTDGGGSTALGWRDNGVRRVGSREDRPVASWVTIRTIGRWSKAGLLAGVSGVAAAAWASRNTSQGRSVTKAIIGALR